MIAWPQDAKLWSLVAWTICQAAILWYRDQQQQRVLEDLVKWRQEATEDWAEWRGKVNEKLWPDS